jgi:fructoselysine-6-P-deglycase FrlB-like protein
MSESPSVPSPSGLALIEAEMQRQHADALASFVGAADCAARIAACARRSGRLLLVGMGGSHYVNRAAEPVYRTLGLDATAIVASELLAQPLPDRSRCVILTSQSGASGEILQLLDQPAGQEERFGLTLDGSSPLAQAVPSLIGAGGMERAFAATRSLLVSLALHAAVVAAFGEPQDSALGLLRSPLDPSVDDAVNELLGSSAVILSGRGELAGLAEAGALCLMELARVPALALEGGQFRHGPLEVLAPGVGVILLRTSGQPAGATQSLVRTCIAAGTRPVIFDASGETPVSGAVNIAFPRLQGFAAAFALLPALQQLLIRIAAGRVERVGEPLRSTKVTGSE